MSKLTDFYLGNCLCSGNTISEIWNKDDDYWEYCHSYIQWMFPNKELSNFNPDAPILSEEDIIEFKNNNKIQMNLLMSFCRFLNFIGLDYSDGKVVETEFFEPIVFMMANHNWLRITRVLKCLVAVGFDKEAIAFYNKLKEMHEKRGWISDNAFSYWKDAMHEFSLE